MEKFLLISIGAVAGANLRYWIGDWAAQRFGAVFPYGTLLINLSGSFLLAVFITLFTERFMSDPNLRVLIAIGFLGSYTTFSTFTFESVSLMTSGQVPLGLANLFASTILGVLVTLVGVWLGKVL